MLYLAPRIAPGAAIHPTSPSSAPAIITVPPLVIAMWRIRVEEKALLATVNGCQAYAERHKRLIPLHLAAIGLPADFATTAANSRQRWS